MALWSKEYFAFNPFELISEHPKEMRVSKDNIRWVNNVLIVYYNTDKKMFIDEYSGIWGYATAPEPPEITITAKEAIEELRKTERYRNLTNIK